MQVDIKVVNAFVEAGRGGNPAGVVLDADALSAAQKLAIAARVGLSETAFVSASETAAFKLEFFTPVRQIAHCGHATVATFSLLRQLGRVQEGWSSKETIDGNRDILLVGDAAYMEQRRPQYREVAAEDPAVLAEVLGALGLEARQLLEGHLPTRVETGMAFILVALRNEADVKGVRPDLARLERLSERFDLVGFYVFSTATREPGRAAGARMFAPRYGIAEESATGMAAGPLACYLHDRLGLATTRLAIEQGYLMAPPSPSLIQVELELEDDRISRLMAGGQARVMDAYCLSL
ncbi:MAG: PhzF family phenazine biosynthesis protein [Pseudomonas sp.]|uniref:PhzF family phenazine biosynthesis protein n=1 Tax=Pseudomonas sp. TaxID=306 RepID=UPI00339B7A33